MKKKYWTNCNSKFIVYYSLIHFSEIEIINNILLIHTLKNQLFKKQQCFPKKFPGKTKDNRNQNFTLNSVETFSFCKTFYHCFFWRNMLLQPKIIVIYYFSFIFWFFYSWLFWKVLQRILIGLGHEVIKLSEKETIAFYVSYTIFTVRQNPKKRAFYKVAASTFFK